MYISMNPEESNHLVKLQKHLKDIKVWITHNFLLLKLDKTEVIVIGP